MSHSHLQMQRATPRVQPIGLLPRSAVISEVISSSGQALDSRARRFMESRFNEDFSSVRVHTDAQAAASARIANAHAYTVGEQIVFASGQYAPNTESGNELIAHELAHTLQQGPKRPFSPENPLIVAPASHALELEAVKAAKGVREGGEARIPRAADASQGPSTMRLFRQEAVPFPGPGDMKARTGVPDMHLREFTPTLAEGLQDLSPILDVLGWILNLVNDRIQEKRIKEEWDRVKQRVDNIAKEYPQDGILVTIYYFQISAAPADPDNPMRPGPVFSHVEVDHGLTRDEAVKKSSNSVREAPPGPAYYMITKEQWIAPKRQPSVLAIEKPFPPVALGAFADSAELQNVEWSGSLGGFDDEGQSSLTVPKGVQVQFFILQLPQSLEYFNVFLRKGATKLLPLEQRAAAEGGKVPVVNLDPVLGLLGLKAAAACVFPANEKTNSLFKFTPKTVDGTQSLHYTNFSYARWVRPEHIKVLSRL